MPQCVFKSCRKNPRKGCVTTGVSYFRFPSNPSMCAKWTSIVARERRDHFYKPAKNSVICSDHFDESDISTKNTNRRRLAARAVPKLPNQSPSMDPQLEEPSTKLSVSDIEEQTEEMEDECSDDEEDISLKQTIRDIATQLSALKDNDSFDGFGRYVASVMRSLPLHRAMAVQPKIVNLLVQAVNDTDVAPQS